MALLLQGKSWTDTGEHRFALEAGPLRLRRAFCGVEREGESFLLRVNVLSRNNALPADAKAELEASVRTPSAAAGRWGWTSPDSVRIRHCVNGHFALTTKKRLPGNSGRVKLMKC